MLHSPAPERAWHSGLRGSVPPRRDSVCESAQETGRRPDPRSVGAARLPQEALLGGGRAGRQALPLGLRLAGLAANAARLLP